MGERIRGSGAHQRARVTSDGGRGRVCASGAAPQRGAEGPVGVDARRGRQGGSALLVTVMLLLMIGLVGLAALNTTMRDQQVAGFQNRKRIALYAAEAGVAEALETLTTAHTPTISTAAIGDGTIYPHGQPSYRPDPNVADPVEDLGSAPFPGMSLNIGQGGLPTYQLNYWRIRVEGQAPGGSQARLEAVSGALLAN